MGDRETDGSEQVGAGQLARFGDGYPERRATKSFSGGLRRMLLAADVSLRPNRNDEVRGLTFSVLEPFR